MQRQVNSSEECINNYTIEALPSQAVILENKNLGLKGLCKCVICGQIFLKKKHKQLTCGNKKCSDKNNYLRHKEVYLENARRWARNHPEDAKEKSKISSEKFRIEKREQFNALMRKGYKNNKLKWASRTRTNKILKCSRKIVLISKECKRCSSVDNLEIHHEIYPTKSEEIRKAITEGKIYYLCRDCHGRRNHHG